MKKIKILVIAVFSIGLLSMVGIEATSGNVNSLLGIENADAECYQSAANNGKCSLSRNCFPNPGGLINCDSTATYGPITPPSGGGGGGN